MPGAEWVLGGPVRTVVCTVILSVLSPALLLAQRGPGVCCGGPLRNGNLVVELKGRVERVQITPGEGMPFVTVKAGDQSTNVYLGSMRYLMALGFNPRVGDEVTVKGFKANNGLMAITVVLPATNKTFRLRDADGRPLWRGGMRGPMQ